MGYGEELAAQAVRLSLGPATTEEDVLRFADVWTKAYAKARSRAM
jgi:cysteine desulfurase